MRRERATETQGRKKEKKYVEMYKADALQEAASEDEMVKTVR